MDKFTTLSGIAAPMPLVNIDTDMIIPKQFLKTIKRSGLGANLFDEMRFTLEGEEIPEFVLNQAAYREARDILMKDAEKGANARIEVDLEAQTITSSDGEVFNFDVDPFKKHCLLNGLDDIGLTMEKAAAIDAFEADLSAARPWV